MDHYKILSWRYVSKVSRLFFSSAIFPTDNTPWSDKVSFYVYHPPVSKTTNVSDSN